MPQSLSSILLHLVFSTKNRQRFITADVEKELHAYLSGIARQRECSALAVNGTEDHVHLLVALSRNVAVCDLLEALKKSSSKWIKTKGPKFRPFQWQAGYAALSIGQSNLAALRRYINDQKLHHRGRSFQDELRELLQKYRIEYDERYLWD